MQTYASEKILPVLESEQKIEELTDVATVVGNGFNG